MLELPLVGLAANRRCNHSEVGARHRVMWMFFALVSVADVDRGRLHSGARFEKARSWGGPTSLSGRQSNRSSTTEASAGTAHEPAIDEVPRGECRACERYALAVYGCIDKHAGPVQGRSAREVGPDSACGFQPPAPSLPIIKVQKGELQDVRRLGETASRQQFRAAYRKELFGAQPDSVEARPIAVAVTHREVDILARKVDVVQRS